jgi:hypothetical protein
MFEHVGAMFPSYFGPKGGETFLADENPVADIITSFKVIDVLQIMRLIIRILHRLPQLM